MAACDIAAAEAEAAAAEKLGQQQIFRLLAADGGEDAAAPGTRSGARVGELFGLSTPTFTLLTSRGLPLHLRPQVLAEELKRPGLFQLPVGDVILREEDVKKSPDASEGCRGFWPHFRRQVTYCSYRNPNLKNSVFGGDALCSVDTKGGRRKVGPQEVLEVQQAMQMDLVAAPGEEVPLDIVAPRRLQRCVDRAGDWLKKILEAKRTEPSLAFEWGVLANIQGGGCVSLRQKACRDAAALPIAGVVVGGLGYGEVLPQRAAVLEAVAGALPDELPRFLPLSAGGPDEVLQAVLLGLDVLEVAYPTQLAAQGVALVFSCEMPPVEAERDVAALEEDLAPLLRGGFDTVLAARVAVQLDLSSPDLREDFGPIAADSPVKQYSRAYLFHLLQVRELLGTMLLAQHNLVMYESLFATMRHHIRKGTLRHFASWFLRTQMVEAPVGQGHAGPQAKRRKRVA